MINGFFNTVQTDAVLVLNHFKGKLDANQEQDQKVALAAVRLIASLGMLLGGLTVLTAAPYLAAAPVGALLKMALGAGMYALSHDAFVMAQNTSDQQHVGKVVFAGVKGFIHDIKDLLDGKKGVNDAARHPVTENTFFRPLWDEIIAG